MKSNSIGCQLFMLLLVAAAAQGSVLRSFGSLEGRITEGDVATRGQFPYQVALLLDGVGVCGGSLISDTIVVTAAHCIDKFLTFEVLLGAQNLYDYDEVGRQSMYTRDALVHPGWNLTSLANDIAFVRLPQPAVLNQYISIIRMPSRSDQETFAGFSATLAGWGIFDYANPAVSPDLKYVTGTVISDAECLTHYAELLTPGHICWDSLSGGSCSSDSGGGIVVKEADGESTVVGLLSAGIGPCDGVVPDLFTKLSYYLDWLEAEAGVTIRP